MSRPEAPATGHVLVADDDASLRALAQAILEDAGHQVSLAADGVEAMAALSRGGVDAVLSDVRMPRADGLAVLRAAQRQSPAVPVILLTAFGTVAQAVEAMQAGALDYLEKPIESPAMVRAVVQRALIQRARAQGGPATDPRAPDAPTPTGGQEAPIFRDPTSLKLLEMVRLVAARDTTVLLSGESGAGKEVIARQIHGLSPRANGPFVGVNCGAIPDELFESTLFGHMKGAFTGAHADHPGVFEQAHGGTLLLDEVAELSAQAQVKLLRALELRRITRVGDTRERAVDVRVVAASHVSLSEAVRAGRFREDLFYRLSVFPLTVPALRDRPGDIMPLAEGVLMRLGVPAARLGSEARRCLERHDWPGNVRALRNVMERAVILAGDGSIEPVHLGLSGGSEQIRHTEQSQQASAGNTLRDMEREAIVEALEAHGGNRKAAANALGIALRTLQYKLKAYGLTRR